MRKLIQQFAKHLAISLLSAENQKYETQQKVVYEGHGGAKASRDCRRLLVAISSRGAFPENSQFRKGYLRRKEEKERQSLKASSSFCGSSAICKPRIARINSASLSISSASLTCRSKSALSFLAFKSRGRLPRLFSSAITSRMSSSFVPLAISEARNDSCYSLANRLYFLANLAIQLTAVNAGLYTVGSRWAQKFALRASSHSAWTASQSGLLAGISEIGKSSREISVVSRPQN